MSRKIYRHHHLQRTFFIRLGRNAWQVSYWALKLGIATFTAALGFLLRVLRQLLKLFLSLPPRGRMLAAGATLAAIGFVTVLALLTRPQKFELKFVRDYGGVYAYTGEIPGASMKTSLGIKNDSIAVKVERQETSIEFLTPFSSGSIRKETNDGILYSDKKGETAYRYKLTELGLKEDILLSKKPVTNRFTSVMRVSGLVINKTSDGLPVFTDKTGNYQFHFARPYAEDAAGNRTYNVKFSLSPTEDLQSVLGLTANRVGRQILSGLGRVGETLTASTYTVYLEVDETWLSDPKRIYPVTIDPTITHNTTATFATGQLNRIQDTGSGSNPNLTTYYRELEDDPYTTALWHLNETSNDTCSGGQDACDSSGNGNHGTATGTTINTTTQLLGAAARTFNGSSDYITVADSDSLDFSSSYTLEAWVYPTAVPNGVNQILIKNSANTTFYGMNVSSAQILNCQTSLSGGTVSSLTTISLNTWTHVACAYNGSQLSVYVNGVLDNTGSRTGALAATSVSLDIGRDSVNAGRLFTGSMDEIRLSSTARTTEEIRADAKRRPYGVYTSPVMDLSKATAFNSLTWDERGVMTGSGETASSSTGLVAQWNFNATSGTTATNDAGAGTCGGTASNCNGTLIGFANTSSQDAGFGTGWTANNRRWGAGALMFDGVSDYVDAGTDASLSFTTGDFTVGAWIRTGTTATSYVVSKYKNTAVGGYLIYVNNGYPYCYIQDTSVANFRQVQGSKKVNDGGWHDIVCTRTGSTLSLYLDGVLDTGVPSSAGTVTSVACAATCNLTIGTASNQTQWFSGVVDVPRIYNRVLPAHEILSNYNAANMEFETRVGNSTTPDDGTWETWKPVTSEVQIDSMDATTALATNVYNTTYDWNVQNVNINQNWIKYDNSVPGTCDSGGGACGTNGRLGLGTGGRADDFGVYLSSVILDGSTYKMWYTCHDGANTRICYAYSSDGLNWTKQDNSNDTNICNSGSPCIGNGRLQLGGNNTGDDTHVYNPSVIKDGSTYKMWYAGNDGATWRSFYATSSDGLTWTKLDNSTTVTTCDTGALACNTNGRILLGSTGSGDANGVLVGTVIKDGSTYKMWYQGLAADGLWKVYMATSSDGLTWIKTFNTGPTASNTCSTSGRVPLGTSSGDTTHIEYPFVLKDGPYYKMWYGGHDGTNEKLMYATSMDGTIWCKVNNANPATSNIYATDGRVPRGSSGGDITHAIKASVIKNGNSYWVWYSGYDGSWRIYHARLAATPETTATATIPKAEGTDSRNVTLGIPQVSDNSIVAQWHLDETSGTGDYFLMDSSGNNNDAGPVGTPPSPAVTEGISGKGRDFNGSTDYLNVRDSTSLKMTRGLTLEAWVRPDSLSGIQEFIIKYSTVGYFLRMNGTSAEFQHQSVTLAAASAITQSGVWYHVVGTWDGATDTLYVNGTQVASAAQATIMSNPATDLNIGAFGNSFTQYFNGAIDEVRVLDRAITYEEVTENYRSGRDIRLSRTIASTDLSGATKVPFYVASDRQGRIGELTVGNSAYANYETDTNTAALWHLEEKSGTGAYLKDSSGNSNNGTPTGTSYGPGLLGSSRTFNGTSDYTSMGNSTSVQITGQLTLEAWVKSTAAGAYRGIVSKMVTTPSYSYSLRETGAAPAGRLEFGVSGTGANFINAFSTTLINDGQWHHVAAVYVPSSAIYVYVDGMFEGFNQTSIPASLFNNAANVTLGSTYTSGFEFWGGQIDEARISNTARTADQIRQTYEIGKRTHPIVIDFKAGLSSNLITGSGDLSFTVDATDFGAPSMGSNLYIGDKIIVRENVNGTTYTAQGDVTSVTLATGATTVTAWDSGSTFPSGGFTAEATAFKWQREWFDPTGVSFSTHRNAVTQLTFRPTNDALGANIWMDDLRYGGPYLTTPTGSTVTSSTGYRYFQYRAIESASDPAVSASLVSVTLDYTANSVPGTPTLDAPTDTATNQSLTPILRTTATDADSDYLRYKIELCTNVGMTAGCQTFDQTASQTGWSGQNTQAGTAYTSGTQATYTVQTALSPATTYYWRSYAIDPGGTNIFGPTQGTPFSFTTSGVPTAPTNLLLNGSTSPVSGVAPQSTPTMSAQFNDPNTGDTTTQAEIQVSTSSDFSAPITHWNSGILTIASTTAGAQSPNITYAGATLQANTTFYWRIRFRDAGGNIGAWSSTATFSTTQLFATNCTLQKNVSNTQIIINWTNNNTVNDGYTVEKSTDAGAFSVLTTTGPTGTSATDSSVTSGHTYAYRVYATLGAQSSEVCTSATLSLQLGNLRMENLQLK